MIVITAYRISLYVLFEDEVILSCKTFFSTPIALYWIYYYMPLFIYVTDDIQMKYA